MTEAKPNQESTRHAVRLSPLPVPKASDILANDLRERILHDEFPEGTALPPERELVEQTRMSRTTVREALRILEVQGLVSIRSGRAGGAFVHRPGGQSVADSVGLVIRGQQIRFAALMETREAIEPSCAELAARYRSEDDLSRIDQANVALGGENAPLSDFLQANIDWHMAVAVATHNELLSGFMQAISRAIYTATDNQSFVDAEVRRSTALAHRSITKAIRDRDPASAARRMRSHVHAYAEAIHAAEDQTQIALSG
jgi:DNA-binding FadR family transcriptional regulator